MLTYWGQKHEKTSTFLFSEDRNTIKTRLPSTMTTYHSLGLNWDQSLFLVSFMAHQQSAYMSFNAEYTFSSVNQMEDNSCMQHIKYKCELWTGWWMWMWSAFSCPLWHVNVTPVLSPAETDATSRHCIGPILTLGGTQEGIRTQWRTSSRLKSQQANSYTLTTFSNVGLRWFPWTNINLCCSSSQM